MLKKILLSIPAVLVTAICVLAYLAEPARDHPFFARGDVMVIAHRGGAGLWPENTIFAFRKAVEMGADVLEMDLRTTKDGEMVLIHDETVDRTTNGKGAISGLTLKEVRSLDVGYNWTPDNGKIFPYRGLGLTIPTLDEVLKELNDALLIIEIKQMEPPIEAPLCEMIRRHGMEEKVVIASFTDWPLFMIRKSCPETATSAGPGEIQWLYILSKLRLDFIFSPRSESLMVPEYSRGRHILTPGFISSVHKKNMRLSVWPVNKKDDMKRFLNMGVDGIITDYPDKLLALLGN